MKLIIDLISRAIGQVRISKKKLQKLEKAKRYEAQNEANRLRQQAELQAIVDSAMDAEQIPTAAVEKSKKSAFSYVFSFSVFF